MNAGNLGEYQCSTPRTRIPERSHAARLESVRGYTLTSGSKTRIMSRMIFSRTFTALISGCAFVALSIPTWAAWPPLQDIDAWEDGEKIRYEVYDPIREEWVRSSSRMSDHSFFDLTTRDGVVFWTATDRASGDTKVAFAVYDPILGEWRTHDKDMKEHIISFLSSRDGVMTWMRTDLGNGEKSVFYATYDPRLGEWRRSQTDFGNDIIRGVTTKDGVVAWVRIDDGDRRVHYAIYDPVDREWVGGSEKHGGRNVETLEIRDSSVSWHYDEERLERGYDAGIHDWYEGPTVAYADFVPSVTSGDPPLFVLFYDSSIGGLSWEWDYGNGDWSPFRNSGYTFAEPGTYEATQIVYGSPLDSTSSVTIQVGESLPTATPTPTIPSAPGLVADLNNDGIVDHVDLLLLQSEWHQGELYTPTPTPSGKVKRVFGRRQRPIRY